jgi:hypothetical protein
MCMVRSQKSIGGAVGVRLGNAPYKIGSQFQSMCMVRSQKSIGGAVGVRLGNAPYKIGVLLRSAFGIALHRAMA